MRKFGQRTVLGAAAVALTAMAFTGTALAGGHVAGGAGGAGGGANSNCLIPIGASIGVLARAVPSRNAARPGVPAGPVAPASSTDASATDPAPAVEGVALCPGLHRRQFTASS